jgi:hypothetical protein
MGRARGGNGNRASRARARTKSKRTKGRRRSHGRRGDLYKVLNILGIYGNRQRIQKHLQEVVVDHAFF